MNVYCFLSVRARAIACFANCLTSRETGLAQTVRDVVTPMSVGGPPGGPRLIKTPGVHLRGWSTLIFCIRPLTHTQHLDNSRKEGMKLNKKKMSECEDQLSLSTVAW